MKLKKQRAASLRCRRRDLLLVAVLGTVQRSSATKKPHKTKKSADRKVCGFQHYRAKTLFFAKLKSKTKPWLLFCAECLSPFYRKCKHHAPTITPQAIRAPELPDGSLLRSSVSECIITERPTTSSGDNLSVRNALHAYPLFPKSGGRSPECAG